VKIASDMRRSSGGVWMMPFAPVIGLIMVLSLLVPLAPGPDAVSVLPAEPWTGPWWAAGDPVTLHWSFATMLLLAVLISLISWLFLGRARLVPRRWRLPLAVGAGLVVWLLPAAIAIVLITPHDRTSQAMPLTVYSLILPALLSAVWHYAMGGEVVRDPPYRWTALVAIGLTIALLLVSFVLLFSLLELGFID
jgi:hypothetical protein